MTPDYCIKGGYVVRERPEYFEDVLKETTGIIWQPDVYPFTAFLARRLGCTTIVDLGCGRADKLVELSDAFDVVGLDFGKNIKFCQKTHAKGLWLEVDFERLDTLPLSNDELARSILVCADVVEHLVNPMPLLRGIRQMLAWSPLAVLSTPERDLCRGPEHFGPPPNAAHVREWNLDEFDRLLRSADLDVQYIGLTRRSNESPFKHTLLTVVAGESGVPAPVRLGQRWDELCIAGDEVLFAAPSNSGGC